MKRGRKPYLNDDELWYEIRLSQGRGILSDKAARMFILIGTNFIRLKSYYDITDTIQKDCFQTGIEMMVKNWRNFNYKKYYKALPYFTEIFKRGMTLGFNEAIDKERYKYTMSINGWLDDSKKDSQW